MFTPGGVSQWLQQARPRRSSRRSRLSHICASVAWPACMRCRHSVHTGRGSAGRPMASQASRRPPSSQGPRTAATPKSTNPLASHEHPPKSAPGPPHAKRPGAGAEGLRDDLLGTGQRGSLEHGPKATGSEWQTGRIEHLLLGTSPAIQGLVFARTEALSRGSFDGTAISLRLNEAYGEAAPLECCLF